MQAASTATVSAWLAGPTDLSGFRLKARALVHQGISPDQVMWHTPSDDATNGQTDSLWAMDANAGDEACTAAGGAAAPALRVPRAYAELCDEALLHADPGRFSLMYRLLWRLQHEPTLRHDPLDADLMAARGMARAVHRDMHKMRAFVRFNQVGDNKYVAWFEPAHHIVEANAPFFMRRFAQMHWAILTPRCCIEWDGQNLRVRPGADHREAPPADAGEALWLTYYTHIFNPARLKLATMAREMPRRYWPNLPEAALIAPLAAAAASRTQAMVAAEPSEPTHQYKLIMLHRDRPLKMHDLPAQAPTPTPASSPAQAHEPPRLPTLAALREAAQSCRNCPIGACATQAVCGEGPLHPLNMIVGEQPGDQEDLVGRPFVGPAGKLLSRAMGELGWHRESVYVTNAVKHFKYELRGTRRMHKTPGQREVEACLPWLDNEIELVRPHQLVALGATAARALLGRKVSITAEHGKWLRERPDGLPVLVTWHPSALLRTPPQERGKAYARWRDDLAVALERA